MITCVGMWKEGSDLPQLNVAALHDPHKSLGITLRFIGRFARVSPAPVGNATVAASRSNLPAVGRHGKRAMNRHGLSRPVITESGPEPLR
ncbi:hypothetical protein [Nonomuraea sp. NPDC050783]|uniref:hypothetical protein n=1 Tax=Nonomuraea sp. NPDC050783 TaxID=3154634 RepID=UPI003465A9D7